MSERFRQLKNQLSKHKKGSKEDIKIRQEMMNIALQYKNKLVFKGPKIENIHEEDFEDLFNGEEDDANNNNNNNKSNSWDNPFFDANNRPKKSLNELDDEDGTVYKDSMNEGLNNRMNTNLDILKYTNNKNNKSKECISPYVSGAGDGYAAF